MTLLQKIEYLEKLLIQPEENFSDTFKEDIVIYFDNDFSLENKLLHFLESLNSPQEIENWIEKLTSRFVMKFDSDYESENVFIYDYIENG